MKRVAQAGERRTNRFWLYTPFILLLLVAIAWSIAWWVIRDRATGSLDAWLASEAQAGRQWACEDRQVGGYPFRIIVACGSLGLKQGPVTASLGRVTSISQVYQPAFVITEIDGPLRVSDGRATLEGTWDLMQSSIHATSRGLQRFSLVGEPPHHPDGVWPRCCCQQQPPPRASRPPRSFAYRRRPMTRRCRCKRRRSRSRSSRRRRRAGGFLPRRHSDAGRGISGASGRPGTRTLAQGRRRARSHHAVGDKRSTARRSLG